MAPRGGRALAPGESLITSSATDALAALLGKDVALRLEEHLNELPAKARAAVADAVRRLVLAAWQLDAFGDLGDQVKVTGAYERFSAAATTIASAYARQ